MQDGNRTSYLSEYKWYASIQSSNQIEARGLFADPIFLQQNPEQRNEDHGNITWKAAYILSDYLKNKTDFLWSGKNVIELGCGTGLVGFTLAKLGAHVTMTDQSHITDLTAKNIELNFSPESNVPTLLELDWREFESSGIDSTFEVIVGTITFQLSTCLSVIQSNVTYIHLILIFAYILIVKCKNNN